MNKPAVLLAAALFLCSLPTLAQKRPQPALRKTTAPAVRFQGAPQYTQDELLAAAGLKANARLTPTEIKAGAKELNDTGFFTAIKFRTDSKGLLFTLTPTARLYPIHLDNLPLETGKDLDDKLHTRFPLYHGQLPANGAVLDGIRLTFEEMLASEGIKAIVKADVTSGLGAEKITAMNFVVTSPSVRIGPVQVTGVSAPMMAKAHLLAAGQSGNAFDTDNTAAGLKHAFEELYQDQGYAAVEAEVTQADPIVSAQAADIPYKVAIREGGVYKLGTIDYPANALVSRAEVQKVLAKYPAGSGRPLDLFLLAIRDAYHARGYLDCSVVPQPSFNEATHIVNYSVETSAGPQYQMAAVQFDGAPDAMAAKLRSAWKLAPAAVFDESYVSGFAALAQKKDKSLSKWMQTVLTTYEVKPDPATHQVNCIFHFVKAMQGGR